MSSDSRIVLVRPGCVSVKMSYRGRWLIGFAINSLSHTPRGCLPISACFRCSAQNASLPVTPIYEELPEGRTGSARSFETLAPRFLRLLFSSLEKIPQPREFNDMIRRQKPRELNQTAERYASHTDDADL